MQLRQRIEIYLQASGIKPTRFGRLAARDPRLVFDMRNGREVGPPLAARLSAWLDRAEAEQGLSGASA